jgi:hypothetical protein
MSKCKKGECAFVLCDSRSLNNMGFLPVSKLCLIPKYDPCEYIILDFNLCLVVLCIGNTMFYESDHIYDLTLSPLFLS